MNEVAVRTMDFQRIKSQARGAPGAGAESSYEPFDACAIEGNRCDLAVALRQR